MSVLRTPVASPPEFTAVTISLPAVMDDIGTFGSLDQAVLVNAERNIVSFVDTVNQTFNRTLTLPRAIDSMAPQSSTVNHFVSSQDNAAYTLQELANGVWKIRQYGVGAYPLQIGYRTNKLYVLARDSNRLNVIDLNTRGVATIATETRPVHFDFSTASNRLYVANETSQSVTTVNITPGSEAWISNTALGFVPKKVKYQSSDNTLYVAGPTQVRALDGTSLATVATNTISGGVSDMDLVTGGVWINSRTGVSASRMDRSSLTTTSLPGSPHLITSNRSVGVVGMMGLRTLQNSNAQPWATNPFSTIYSTLTNLFTYNAGSRMLQIFPYSTMGTTTFASASLPTLMDVQRWGSDAVGNLWMASTDALKLQRVTANYQLETLTNLAHNRPVDLTAFSAVNRVYFLARNMNALFTYDTVNDRMTASSVCQAPSKILLDSISYRLFILCAELNAISVVNLDAFGDPLSQSFLTTALQPFDMQLYAANQRLYVSNRMSNSVLVFDTASLATAPTSLSVSANPTAMAIDTVTNTIHTFHQSARTETTINGTTNAVATNTIASYGFVKAAVDTATSVSFAIANSPPAFYASNALSFALSGSNLLDDASRPNDLAVTSVLKKAFVSYGNSDVVRTYDENTLTYSDVAVGSNPQSLLISDALNKVFVSNFDANSVTVLNRTTNAVLTTVNLANGCGPTRASIVVISGVYYAYVLCQSNDTVERFNASNYSKLSPLTLRVQ
jgi:YVTN family beta-propeller protein